MNHAKRDVRSFGGDRKNPAKRQRTGPSPRRVRVEPLPQDDPGQGHVVALDYELSYGFVETVNFYDAPVKVDRTGRGHHPLLPPPTQFVHIAFDCVSALWFDFNVPFNGQYAWDTAAFASNSFRAEIEVPAAWYAALNQRTHPVTGLLMPAVAEGTWWTLRFDPMDPAGVPALLTLPASANPVSTILSTNQQVDVLADLLIPHNFMRLRRFSHGWDFGPQPADLPPYPGR